MSEPLRDEHLQRSEDNLHCLSRSRGVVENWTVGTRQYLACRVVSWIG